MKVMFEKIKKINIFIKIFIVIIISFVISFLITNYEIIKNGNMNIINVDNLNIKYEGLKYENNSFIPTSEKSKIIIELNGMYANKIKFNYANFGNFTCDYNIHKYDYYGNIYSEKISCAIVNQLDMTSINVRSNVSEIEFNFTSMDFKIHDLYVDNRLYFNIYIYIPIFLIINCIFFLLFNNSKHLSKIENKFLLIGVSLGLMFIICLPADTGLSFDDQIHYTDVYKLSEGETINKTVAYNKMKDVFNVNFIDVNTIEERNLLYKYYNSNHNYNSIDSVENDFVFSYTHFAYIPMAIITKILNTLNVPFIITFLTAKFINLLVYLLPIYFAIKIIPICKRVLFCIGLVPTSLFLASSYSCDPTVISFLVLAVTIFIYEYINKNKKLGFKNTLIFIISTIYGCLPKAVYIPMLLLLLILPKEKFVDRKREIKFKIGIILIFVTIMATFVVPATTSPSMAGDSRGGNTSVTEQLKLIKNQPISFAKVFKKNAGGQVMDRFLGNETLTSYAYIGNIYDNDTNIPLLLVVILIFVLFTDTYNNKKVIDKKCKMFMLSIIFVIYILIWVALYLSFTPIASITMNGVQGRYFLPLLFPLFVCLNSKNIKNQIKEEKYDIIISLFMTILVFVSIWNMIIQVYCF